MEKMSERVSVRTAAIFNTMRIGFLSIVYGHFLSTLSHLIYCKACKRKTKIANTAPILSHTKWTLKMKKEELDTGRWSNNNNNNKSMKPFENIVCSLVSYVTVEPGNVRKIYVINIYSLIHITHTNTVRDRESHSCFVAIY